MIDRGIGRLAPAQGLARVPVLPARLLAGPFPQTADANWLLQAVAGRRFAAIATVQAKPAFQFGDPLLQLRDQGLLRGVLFPQCRNDGLQRRPIAPTRARFAARINFRRLGHGKLDSCPESGVKTPSNAAIWVVTIFIMFFFKHNARKESRPPASKKSLDSASALDRAACGGLRN